MKVHAARTKPFCGAVAERQRFPYRERIDENYLV
jgi:hypothetical protein